MRKAIICIVLILLLSTVTVGVISAQKGMLPVINKDVNLPEEIYHNKWALLIGINKYPNLPVQYQLQYADNDVKELKKVLLEQYEFLESNIVTLINEQATYQGIKEKFAQLSDTNKVNSNDCVLIYFSGHGQTVPLPRGGDMGFIIPYDAKVDMSNISNPSTYYATCLGMDELKRLARMIPAKHVMFLVDACYSGLAIISRGGFQTSIPGYLRKVASVPVQQIITAGMKNDVSSESPEWGHGAFTYKLLEALNTGVADENDDGITTGLELAAHLRNMVPNISPKQTPQYGYFDGEGEFLFIHANATSESNTPEKSGPGMLYITVTGDQQTNATVFVNNKEIGSTPYTDPAINSGTYEVRVSKPMYHDYIETVNIAKNRKYTVKAILKPAFGYLKVTSVPSGALVELSDMVGTRRGSGNTAFQLDKIPSGSYKLRVSKERYYTEDKDIQIQDAQETVESLILKSKVGTLKVESVPTGARVLLAGKEEGKTPLNMEVDVGRYVMELQSQDNLYLPWSGEIEVRGSETTQISQQLSPNFGILDIQVTPEGSQIVVDGKLIGQTPTAIKLLQGEYRVEVNNQDKWIPLVRKSVSIAREKTEIMTGALEQKTGTLRVISTPLEANIIIDGKEYGVTPDLLQFPIGNYKLKLDKEGFSDHEETVNIEWNKTLDRNIEMKEIEQDVAINTAINFPQNIPSKPITETKEQKIETPKVTIKPERTRIIENRKDITHVSVRLKLTSFSIFMPGLGQYVGKRYVSGTIFLLMGLGTAAGAAIGYMQYDQSVDTYNQAKISYHDAVTADAVSETEQKMVAAYNDAENKFLLRRAGFIAVGSIWALNVLHILIAGASDSHALPQTQPLGWNVTPQVTPDTVGLLAWSRF